MFFSTFVFVFELFVNSTQKNRCDELRQVEYRHGQNIMDFNCIPQSLFIFIYFRPFFNVDNACGYDTKRVHQQVQSISQKKICGFYHYRVGQPKS